MLLTLSYVTLGLRKVIEDQRAAHAAGYTSFPHNFESRRIAS